MRSKRAIQALFFVAAAYDGVLGAVFLFASGPLFEWVAVTPPNRPGYVHFSAALLIVFAVMFTAVALHPVKNRCLIPYGILLKVSYCSVVIFHWVTAGVPNMWKPFCIADLVFMILFTWALAAIKKEAEEDR